MEGGEFHRILLDMSNKVPPELIEQILSFDGNYFRLDLDRVGITDISSKLSAKTAFIKPINANKTDVKKSTVIVSPILAI